MAKHEVVIHENTGATKELAPYLGSYIGKETVEETSFIHKAAQLCGLSAVQLQAILDGSFEAIEELEKSELVRVHTDVGVISRREEPRRRRGGPALDGVPPREVPEGRAAAEGNASVLPDGPPGARQDSKTAALLQLPASARKCEFTSSSNTERSVRRSG